MIAGVVCLIGSSGKSGGKMVTLLFFLITGSFLPLGLLIGFLLFRCVLSYPFLIETSEFLPFETLRRVIDPLSIKLSSSFLGTSVPFVPIPHSDTGKLVLLRFLNVGHPLGTLWLCALVLPLLVQVLFFAASGHI